MPWVTPKQPGVLLNPHEAGLPPRIPHPSIARPSPLLLYHALHAELACPPVFVWCWCVAALVPHPGPHFGAVPCCVEQWPARA